MSSSSRIAPVGSESSARTLPAGLAPLIEALELDRAELVTTADLEQLRREAGISTPARVMADRLRKRGWLLPTGRRGVYEFAPGANAGAVSAGRVGQTLQVLILARPDITAALTFQSAAWALGAADRAPARLEIAVGDARTARQLAPILVTHARITWFAPALPPVHARSVPVLRAESVIVHLAARPGDVRSWSSAPEWLPALAETVVAETLAAELARRPRSVTARTAYLLSGLRPDITTRLPAGHGVVYFGGRGPTRRRDAATDVVDTVLPFDPRDLQHVTPTDATPQTAAATITERR